MTDFSSFAQKSEEMSAFPQFTFNELDVAAAVAAAVVAAANAAAVGGPAAARGLVGFPSGWRGCSFRKNTKVRTATKTILRIC